MNRYAPGRQVLLIGESWGGMFATRYINEFPSRVAGAVLIEPGAARRPDHGAGQGPAYTTPVLFIAGSRSEVLGESLQRQQVYRYPSATLEVVAGAGHDVAWVKAADVVAHVRRYLDSRRAGVQ